MGRGPMPEASRCTGARHRCLCTAQVSVHSTGVGARHRCGRSVAQVWAMRGTGVGARHRCLYAAQLGSRAGLEAVLTWDKGARTSEPEGPDVCGRHGGKGPICSYNPYPQLLGGEREKSPGAEGGN